MTKHPPRPARPTARDLMKEVPALISHEASVGEAAAVLQSADVEAAPVVDSDGRCVGLFSAGDFRRWAARAGAKVEVVSDWQLIPPPPAAEEVRNYMTRRYGVATPGAAVPEMLHRLREAPDAFLVVLDHQRRPQGLVHAIDLLRAESVARRAARDAAATN
jgi:CBS domain-containing protein